MWLDRMENFESSRPKCDPSKEVLHGIATLKDDISPVFPYLNAELGGWDYDQNNQVVLLKVSAGKWITLQPREIAIRGARDQEELQALLEWIKGQINEIYERRDRIPPRYTSQAGLKVMEFFKLLPRTNCKACGYPTCMAYAAALRDGEISLNDCPPLWEAACRVKLDKLQAYLESFGWRAIDAE